MTSQKPHNNFPDKNKRRFLIGATSLVGAVGALIATFPFISSWFPSAKAKAAGSPVEVDLRGLEPGAMTTVEWRGKPVWIIRRTEAMIQRLKTQIAQLRDPDSKAEQQPDYAENFHRAIREEYLVLIGICTHLGCAPTYKPNINELGPNWPGGFYCPCHGSTFDLAGRVFKGVPAPINLEVPPYRYLNDYTILVGDDKKNG